MSKTTSLCLLHIITLILLNQLTQNSLSTDETLSFLDLLRLYSNPEEFLFFTHILFSDSPQECPSSVLNWARNLSTSTIRPSKAACVDIYPTAQVCRWSIPQGRNQKRETMFIITNSKFPLGQVVATEAVYETIPHLDIQSGLQRHANGDWGKICEEDRNQNDDGLANGDNRLMSVYTDSNDTTFWIITEWDRSVTTVLLPSDY